VSLAVFALVVLIWVVLLVPLARRGRAELAYEASEGGRRLSSGGARPWTSGNLPAEPSDEELAAAERAARLARRRAARRRAATRRRRALLVLVVAAAAGSRAWVVLGGRWWLAAAVPALALAAYLLALVVLGSARARAARARAAGLRVLPGRRGRRRPRERWTTPAPWGGQVPVSTE
jgi:hypothetical protein